MSGRQTRKHLSSRKSYEFLRLKNSNLKVSSRWIFSVLSRLYFCQCTSSSQVSSVKHHLCSVYRAAPAASDSSVQGSVTKHFHGSQCRELYLRSQTENVDDCGHPLVEVTPWGQTTDRVCYMRQQQQLPTGPLRQTLFFYHQGYQQTSAIHWPAPTTRLRSPSPQLYFSVATFTVLLINLLSLSRRFQSTLFCSHPNRVLQ